MNTSVCGVEPDTTLDTVSDKDLCRLWQEVGRHTDPSHLTQLRGGMIPPRSELDRRYLNVYAEMQRRRLPFISV